MYRHLSNEEVTLDALLEPHILRTVERVTRAGLAFAVSDTTELTFTGEKASSGIVGAEGTQAHAPGCARRRAS
jgi:hypothetical protein